MERVLSIRKKCSLPELKAIGKAFTEGIVFIGAVGYLFYNNLIVSIVISPCLYFFVRNKMRDFRESQKRVLNMQFKDAILAVSFSLNAGYSMENSFRAAVSELILLYGKQSMIVQEFQNIVRRVENNENIEDVLNDFAERSCVEDILYFAQIFQYAKRSGADIITIIKNTAATIRQKQEVENEIQTIISGKKLEQRVMEIMPFAMIAYLRLTSPEFITPLYGNAAGIAVMTVCLIVYIAADYIAGRIIKIDV